jgi:hypothetical protein
VADAPSPDRERLTALARRRLADGLGPRWTMAGILFVAGAVAFVSSAVMLRVGVTHMAVRYPLAVGWGYLGFLFLLWLWLRSAHYDALDAAGDAAYLAATVEDRRSRRSGGWFHGWGGGGKKEGDGNSGGGSDDAGGLLVAILVAVLISAVLFVAIYALTIAPTLLAELLVDAAVVGALPKKDARYWGWTAVRRTGLLALGLAGLFLLVGAGLEAAAPGSHTLGRAMGFGRPH